MREQASPYIADLLNDYFAKHTEINQRQFALAADVNPAMVTRWRRRESVPTWDSCIKLARAMKLPEEIVLDAAGYRSTQSNKEPLDPEALNRAIRIQQLDELYKGMLDNMLHYLEEQQASAKRRVILPKSRPVNRRIRKLTGTEGGSSDELTRCLLALSPLGNVADQPNGLTGLARSADAALATRGT